MDIVVTNSYDNTISVLLGDSNRVFKYQMTLVTGNGACPRSIALGDFNSDTHMDISVGNSGTNNVGIFHGVGNGSFSTQLTYSASGSPSSIAVGDFNNDTHLDVVVGNSDDNSMCVLLGHENGSFTNRVTYLTGFKSQVYSVADVDFDKDAILDIIATNYDTGNIVVFTGCSNGTFANPTDFRIGFGAKPFSVGVADFNMDKKMDFAVASYGYDNLQIYLQTC